MNQTPRDLIDSSGRPRFGVYYQPIEHINLDRFDFRKVAPLPFRFFNATSRLAIKRWQYVGLVSHDIILGMAVVDISYVRSAFVYTYVRGDGRVRDHSFLDPLKRQTRFSSSSIEGMSSYESRGVSLTINNNLGSGARSASAWVKGKLEADFTFDEAAFSPLCAVTRNGLRGFNYCHKAAGVPVSGRIRVGGHLFELNAESTYGQIDWTAGCAAHHTFWNWASGGGSLPDGRRIGLNFVAGINDQGFTENCYWIDGQPTKVDTVHFDYDDDNIQHPWTIRSADGKVDLTFEPEGERAEDINLGLLLSRFHQPFGRFHGTLKVGRKRVPVDLTGFVEEHEARW